MKEKELTDKEPDFVRDITLLTIMIITLIGFGSLFIFGTLMWGMW